MSTCQPLSPDAQEFYDLLSQMDEHGVRVIGLLVRLMELPHEKVPENKLEWEQYNRMILGIARGVFQEKAMLDEVTFTENLIRQSEARVAELKGNND